MNNKGRLILILLPLVTAALISCSGTQLAGGGTGGTGAAMGTVTGFGSVFVNGIEYQTDRAVITVDGQSVTDERAFLGLGMVVRVKAELRNGVWSADSIDYRSDIRGPAASIGSAGFEVFGRLIKVTADTQYDGVLTTFGDLGANDFVEVSGFVDELGDLVATRVASDGTTWNAGDTVEMRGFVEGVSPVVVSGVTVDVLSGSAATGDFVHVEGEWDGASSTITNARLEVEEYDLGAEEGDEVEMEGIVTAQSDTRLTINNIQVEAAGAELEGLGSLAEALGKRVEVEGRYTGGLFVAEEVSLELESDIELRAEVSAWDAGAGTVTVLGKPFTITAETAIEDKAAFFDDLTVGTVLSIHAYRGGAGGNTYFATEVELEGTGPTTVELQGVVDATNAVDALSGTVTVAGVLVQLDAGDVPGGNVAAYLASLVPGTSVVEVTGTESTPGEIDADNISGP